MYSSKFGRVLASIGPVTRLEAPPDPHITQRLRQAVRGFASGLQSAGRARWIHVELGGRGLFEFFFALGVTLVPRRAPLVVTCHDAPSIAGAPLLFAFMDRRGLRRVGTALSGTLGARLERRLMASVDAAVCLTMAGSEALEERYGGRVTHLPHVTELAPTDSAKEPIVFVPGYVDDVEGIVGLARAVAAADDTWSLVVGACPPWVERTIREGLAAEGAPTPRFTGQVREDRLMGLFERSAIVARLRRGAPGSNALAASGPLAWAAGQGCACVTNDDRAGARELEEAGVVMRHRCPAQVVAAMIADGTWRDHGSESRLRAADLMGLDTVSNKYRQMASRAGLMLPPE